MMTVQEMEYIFGALIGFQIRILESIQELKNLEILKMTSTEAYLEQCENIRIYSKKEKMLLARIKCLPCEFEKHAQSVITNLENYVPVDLDEEQINILSSRLIEIFGYKCKELVKENIEAEEDEGVELFYSDEYGTDDIGEQIELQINTVRLREIQEFIDKEEDEAERKELIEYKYNLICESKMMTVQMLEVEMNPHFLFSKPEDVVIKELSIDENDLRIRKKQEIILIIDYLIDIVISPAGNIEKTLKSNVELAILQELLDSLSTPDLAELLNKYLNESRSSNKPNYKVITEIIDYTLNKRADYIEPSSELNENKLCDCIPGEIFDKFVSLIKLSELIVEKHKELCKLEKNVLKGTPQYETALKTLANYLEIEKELLDDFDFSSNISETLEDILNDYLDILLKNKNNAKMVQKRISNMLPDINLYFTGLGCDNEITYSIHTQFYLKTIKRLEEMIGRVKNTQLKRQLIEEKYRQASYHQCIGEDMISTNFTPTQVYIFDEETLIEVLGISDLEYGFNKDEELYILGNMILYDMISNHMNDGSVIYGKICLKEILENVSYETLYSLETLYDEQMSLPRKNSKRILKKLQLKPLFKKRQTSY